MNPYSHPRLKRIKRTSKLRYGWTCLILLPQFLAWKLSELIPESLGWRLRRCFGFLWIPMKQMIGLFQLWLLTRTWKKLLLALPLLLALAWLISTLYLANNQTDEELFGDYRSGLLSAASRDEFQLADFMAGKLLQQESFEDDQEMLYVAMIAANGSKNILRRDLLLNRLTKESHYSPAHMWYAQKLLRQSNVEDGNLQLAIQHVKEALKASENPEPIRVYLARVYYQARRSPQAIRILEDLADPSPGSSVLLAKLYLSIGAQEKANATAAALLQRLDQEDPTMRQSLDERMDALKVLAESSGDRSLMLNQLATMETQLENKARRDPENESYRALLSHVYLVRAMMRLGQIDDTFRDQALDDRQKAISTGKAFDDLQKAISTGKAPYQMGVIIYSASNMDSSGGLTEEQVRSALMQGKGVAVAHIFLGLNAWKKELMDKAEFHFQLAHALEPETLKVVEYVASHIAKASTSRVDPHRLSQESEPLWSRAIRLLEMSSKIDASRAEANFRTQYLILSQLQRWDDIMVLVEPRIDQVSDKYRRDLLRLLIKASRETSKPSKTERYTKMLQAEMLRLDDE